MSRVGERTTRCGAKPQACHRSSESGIALLLAVLVMFALTAFAASLVLFTQSDIRLSKAREDQAQAFYAAVAGLEEARGRLRAAAPDAINSGMRPQTIHQVLYLINSSAPDPVNPTDPSSAYYDAEYAPEFPGGFGSAQVLGPLPSDQPGAGTSFAIPYKWVRITLKTEYSSGADVDQNGVLDSTTPIYWDGAHQDLAPHVANGVPVYKLTALAVEPSGIRKIVQAEVAGTPPLKPPGGLGSATSVNLVGVSGLEEANLRVNGMDACDVQSIPGIAAGGTVATSGSVNLNGSPNPFLQNLLPYPQSAADLIQNLRPTAVPLLNADPAHVALSADSTTLVGTNVVLGHQATASQPAQPLVAYADRPLTISGSASGGEGILLVQGNLSINGAFNFRGLIVANGTVTLANDATGSITTDGAVISSGNLTANSSGSPSTSLTVTYDSCALADNFQNLRQGIRAFRELSF